MNNDDQGKKSYLIFDTETTGLPKNWRAPASDVSNWPRVVQLAWHLYDDAGTRTDEQNLIVAPKDFVIPSEVALLHGITQERALREGLSIDHVLQIFEEALARAHVLVAHNLSFDEKVLGAEFLRHKGKNLLEGKETICTMERTIEYCAIPGMYGNKWPRLEELYRKLFQEGFENAHDASVDVAITAKCFWELKKRAIL